MLDERRPNAVTLMFEADSGEGSTLYQLGFPDAAVRAIFTERIDEACTSARVHGAMHDVRSPLLLRSSSGEKRELVGLDATDVIVNRSEV